jgi:FkbM family methyltransferase
MLNISYGDFFLQFPNYIDSDVSWYQSAEMQTKKYYINNIKNNFNVIDAGAQIGMYTILFSKLASNGKVFAFEPTDNIEMLKKNIIFHNCSNVTLLDDAVSNINMKKTDKIYKIWSQQKIEEKEFSFVTIDKFIVDNKIDINLIKIDVDSYDYEALMGCEKTIKTQKPIIVVELNHALHKRNFTIEQPIEYMQKLDYKILAIYDNENYVFTKK